MLLTELFRLLRVYQWPKNGFVFAGVLFSHLWHDGPLLTSVLFVAIAFCFVSSSVYIFNDLFDIRSDRNHPTKKNRPIASGKVSVQVASLLSGVLFVTGILLSFFVSELSGGILLSYAILNVFYTLWLKRVVILDVFCIALGFMLRILAGTLGIGIAPSKWLLVCGLFLTLFLGFTKRRAELSQVEGSEEGKSRESLQSYQKSFLDQIIAACAGGVILSYSLYTMSPETVALHHTDQLMYTIPFVTFGIFRYLFLLYSRKSGGDPSWDLARDPQMLGVIGAWLVTTILILK